LAVWPARLEPEKGILPFLKILDPNWLSDWLILIIGQGRLLSDLNTFIRERDLSEHVRVSEYLPYNLMPAIYSASDLFLLPSISDQNPLTVVEALHSGLPILLSSQCGNFAEALREDWNGWGFDPNNQDEMRGAAEAAFVASPDSAKKMGLRSAEIAKQFWDSDLVVKRFCSEVLDRHS
jgi:glycosyltransferase involved in cell wall biosynthesis